MNTTTKTEDVNVNDSATGVATIAKKHKVVLGAFGNGRYSPAMEEVYKDTIRLLGFSEAQAHVVAAQVGRDAGQLNNQKVKSVSIGKSVSKDGKIGLKEVVDSMKVTCTWALSIASICSQLDATRKMGLVVNDVTVVDRLLLEVDAAAERIEAISKEEMEKLVASK